MDRLQSMRVFQRVVDEGSFSAAARSLDMSPAVVTRLVADLEEHLGTRLMQRTTRRMSLTEAGETYLSRVRHILQDIDEVHAMTSSQTHELAGVLRLLTPPVLATHVVAPLLAEFRATYPHIVLDIEVSYTSQPPVEDYDITLLVATDTVGPDVIVRKVIESEAVLVASPAYLQRRGTPQQPQDLAQHECLRLKHLGVRPRSWHMWREEAPAGQTEVEVAPVVWCAHSDTLMRAALDGAGITSMAVDLVAPYLTHGDLVRVLNPWITGKLTLNAAFPSRKFMPQRTRVFLEYLIERTQRDAAAALQVCMAC